MESWSFGSEGKGFVSSDDFVPPIDSLARSRTLSAGWDLRTPINYNNTMLISGRDATENQGVMEFGLPNNISKQLSENSTGEFTDFSNGSGRISSSSSCMLSSFLGEQESSSRISSSVVDPNGQDSSLIDLKLGRITDYRDAKNSIHSKKLPSLLPVPEKRARTTSLSSHIPFCQVLGCNKDLSSSKDYHKRHKVCDAHSKTARVIVNGIEQRFCQQCSRFHLLAEFDDGKRSCRKRLAGHNERRRKPQLENHYNKTVKMLPSYHGRSRLLATSLPTNTSFICAEIFPKGTLHPDKYGTGNWSNRVKLEDGAIYSPQSAIPITNSNIFSKTSLPPFEQPYPSFNSNVIHTASGSISYDNTRYGHNFPGPISSSVLRNTPSESDDFTVYDTASTLQGLSGVSDSGCALSLLSSQSQNSSNCSSETRNMGYPLDIIQTNHAHTHYNQFSKKFIEASTSVASNIISSSGMNSVEVDPGPILVSDASDAVNIFEETEFLSNSKDLLSDERGNNSVDLLQLSSELQLVEDQKNSMQVIKQENDFFESLPYHLS